MGKNYGLWNFKRRVEKKVGMLRKHCRAQIAGGNAMFIEVAMGLRYIGRLMSKVNDGKMKFVLNDKEGNVVGEFESERDVYMSPQFAELNEYRVKIVFEYECGVVARNGRINDEEEKEDF